MKAFTNFSQSKKLAEILPLKSADMCYERVYFEGKQSDWFVRLGRPIKSDDIIPCWSLAALLNVLPDSIYDNTYEFSQLEFTKKSVAYIHGTTDGIKIGALKDNLVDACYEMIIKLHEQKLL